MQFWLSSVPPRSPPHHPWLLHRFAAGGSYFGDWLFIFSGRIVSGIPGIVGGCYRRQGCQEKENRRFRLMVSGGCGVVSKVFLGGSSVVLEACSEYFLGLAASLAGEAEDGGPVDEAVYGGYSGCLVGEEGFPAVEACVGGENDRALAVPG